MVKKTLEEGQIVLCTVDRIAGTIVFIRIEDYDTEGTITFSEISPGRIRNIRDYAFPGKKIVCKVLRVKPQGVDLSLRRVKLKERNELNESLRIEKSYKSLFKSVLGDKTDAIINKIKDTEDLIDLIEESKEDINKLAKYISKADAEKIIKILKEKKAKEKIVGRKFQLSSKEPNGMVVIKALVSNAKGEVPVEISYVAAGKYTIKIKSRDLRKADQQMTEILEKIEEASKEKNCLFALGDYIN